MFHTDTFSFFFFFNDTATTEIYTLSLHDALPIYPVGAGDGRAVGGRRRRRVRRPGRGGGGHRGGPPAARLAADADRVLPAGHVRARRDDGLRRGEQPAADVRRAGGAVPPALPALRAGPAAPAAVPGGGGQVLPARRVRLRVLPLRAGAAVRVLRLGQPAGHPAVRRGRCGQERHAAVRRARAAAD